MEDIKQVEIQDEVENNENIEVVENIIPKVYVYSSTTYEYLYSKQAERDNAESLAQGKFVPLVNACETLLTPPVVDDNQIAVYSATYEDVLEQKIVEHLDENEEIKNEIVEEISKIKVEKWEIKPDFRKNFVLVDDKLNVHEIAEIGDVQGIKATKELGAEIEENPNSFKIVNNEIIRKSDEEIETENAEKSRQQTLQLYLTSADVERAIYKAIGLTFDDIVAKIETSSEQIDIKALKIELRANNFYRGNTYVEKIGSFLGFTSEQLDNFFKSGNYEYLLTNTGIINND